MKRKLLLFAALLSFSPFLFGQTFIWESFNAGEMPPDGWSLNGFTSQWSVGNSNNAGGVAPEAIFTWANGSGTSRFISPPLDLTGLTSVTLNFWHMYDDYTGAGPVVGVATRPNSGGAWTSVWEISPNANVGPQEINIVINNSDVGSSTFQFCFYVDGNLYNLDYYYLDNILLFNPLNLDAGMTAITTPTYIGAPVEVTGEFMNFGTTPVTSAEIKWQADGGPVYSTTLSGLNVGMLESYAFTCTDLFATTIGSHDLVVWLHSVNGVSDEQLSNDTLNKTINKVCHVIPRKPLFEEFTSSTCAPCASFNSGFVPWCDTHADEITLVKYQMNWPSPGDPYYTAEGGVRRDFYGVSYVPDLYLNGTQTATDMGAVQAGFEASLEKPGLAKIASTYSVSGTTIDLTATVLPFTDFANLRFYVVVFENITTGNVMSNGETEFEHVMMKMIPNGNGTTVNMSDREPYTLAQQVDLSGTNVEEFDDLGVAVFVQGTTSKEVYQSAYSEADATFGTEAHLSQILIDGTPMNGFTPEVFEYTVNLPSGAILVPDVVGVPVDENATVIVVPAVELPGTSTIDVFGEDLISHNLYSIEFTVGGIGIDDPATAGVSVYPNPANDRVFIMNAHGSKITLYTAGGAVVRNIDQFNSTSIDLSGLNQGVYFMVLEKPDGTVIRKKIVVL